MSFVSFVIVLSGVLSDDYRRRKPYEYRRHRVLSVLSYPYNTYHHIIYLFILMTVYVSKSVFILHMTKLTK